MRNLKKFLALILAMMMTFSLMVTVNAADSEFTDSEQINEKFVEAVNVLEGMGVFKGYKEGDTTSFKPGDKITRAEVAAIVYRLATGDAAENQAHLYVDGSKFTDVVPTDWFAGVVGYCANNNLILGYGNGKFGPNDNVTGIQALTMILRAVGYGKNGEFQGDLWETNAYGRAHNEGLLKNVDNTNYASKLSLPATRELVAELLFQAANIPTVTWTMLGDYSKTSSILGGDLNPSLGYRNYGLTTDTGIVLGNQATGEDNTLVGFVGKTGVVADGDPNTNEFIKNTNGSYTYDSAANTNLTVPFDAKTGLDMFGHKAKVWYDGRDNADGYTIDGTSKLVEQDANKTYAVIDKAVLSAYVYSEDGTLSETSGETDATKALLGTAAKDAGFTVKRDKAATGATGANTTATLSEIYKRIDDTKAKADATDTKFTNASPVNMYYLVSNNSGKTVDVAVSLSAEVGVITEKNTTAAKQYLTLGAQGTVNESAFGNSDTDHIYLKKLTPDSVQKLGELVTAWEVRGTTKAAPVAADYFYQLDEMKTVTKQVSNMKVGGDTVDSATAEAIVEVTFTDGTTMKLSGITLGNKTKSKIISQALPVVVGGSTADGVLDINLTANKDYTVYVDVLGRFISMTTGDDVSFLYATFADFQMGALGEGTNKYAITGVDKDGKIVANHDLTAMDISGTMTKIVDSVGTTYSSAANFPITKKDYSSGSNQILEGANTGYMITKDGQITEGDGNVMANGDDWPIKTSDVNVGVAKVTADSVEYLLTENTQFYVVEGSGTATLKVTPYKGIKALLGDSSSVEISYHTKAVGVTDYDQVVFWTEEDLYGTVNTDSNHNVAKVILSDTNLTRWGGSSMFYNFNADKPTGLTLPGAAATVAQFELYANGEKGTYFIDTDKSLYKDGSTKWSASGKAEKDTFYTLTKIDEVNGTPIYRAVGVAVKDALSYADGLNTGVTYNYVAVNNLNFADLNKKDATDHLIFNVADAKICDAEYNDGTLADPDVSVKNDRGEITTIAELNNAISVMKSDGTSPVYTLTVAVVYDNNNVATLYITELAAN